MNNVFLTGNLVRDPELRHTPNGSAVTDFGVAVNEFVKNGENKVHFFDCTAWKRQAELVSEYCKKGSKVLIEGKLVQDRWTNPEGENRNRVYVLAQRVEFLNTKTSSNGKQSDKEETEDEDTPF